MRRAYKRYAIALLFIVVLLIVQRADHLEEQAQTDSMPSPTENVSASTNSASIVDTERTQATVVRIIDGDTIEVTIDNKVETIRVIGINTPETVDPRRPVECFGKEASKKAEELLFNNVVFLELDDSQSNRDRYHRLLRYIFLSDGTDFGKYMIENGYAYEYTYDTPYRYQTEYKQMQLNAEEQRRGLWAENAC
ncbi:thermonuclease family protein [Candidatus Roizmanbacteria bacterium]|nr:thermonuclease family protein [Candidatus Roizmanbacteria bacterium]